MNSPILRKASASTTINTTTGSSNSTATVMEDEEHKTCEYFFTPRSNNNNSNNRARTGSSSGQLFYLSSSLAGSQGCLSPGTAVPLSPASHSQPRQKQYQPVQLQQRRLSASEMEEYSSYGWATHWEDTGMDAPENNNHNNNNGLPPPPPPLHSQQQQQQQVMSFDMDLVVDSLPPQLHPAVSLGMKRVSSCAYFSLQGSCSEADLHSLSSEIAASEVVPTSEWDAKTSSSSSSAQQQQQEQDEHSVNTADWLYHDVITQVLTFLDASSLAAFSETARRCNFECFYFLQLQLQRALLEDNLHHHYGSLSLSHNQQPQQQQQDDRLAAIAGSWSISRLASLDKKDAESVVQEYLDSNSTLRTMPLSHSLAYIRQVLRRHGFPVANSTAEGQLQHPHGFTTSAAVLIGLVGAATVMSGNVNVEVVESFGTELPNMLFKVGFVGSLMGAARHKAATQTHSMRETAEQMARSMQSTMRDTAEQMARTMQHVRMTGAAAAAVAENVTNENNAATLDDNETATTASPRGAEEEQQQPEDSSSPLDQSQQKAEPAQPQEGSISQRMYEAFLAASGRPSSPEESDDEEESASSQQQQQQQELEVLGPNPYEHLPSDLPPPPVVVTVKKEEAETDESSEETQKISKNVGSCNGTLTDSTSNNASATEANVVGNDQCSAALNDSGSSSGVAAIETNCANGSDAIVTKTPPKMPSGCVGAYFRAIRRASNSITQLVQQQRRARFEALPDKDLVAQAFIDACCLDGSLDIVKDMVQRRGVIDAQGFYVGSDGTETCALHASAFHGATKVLEFLCGGIDERDASNDQGLCSVDVQDVNGWTALHFAAGANCVESIRILADRGASLSVTAENGYTPLQWAQRLQNKEAMEELQKRLQQKGLDTSSNSLSMIAHHFFALIPSH